MVSLWNGFGELPLQAAKQTIDLLLIGDNRDHFLLHLLVEFVVALPDLDIFGILLNQCEDSLQDRLVYRIISNTLSVGPEFLLADHFDLLD